MNNKWNREELHSLYKTIFKRKSVRKYKEEKLSKDMLNNIKEALNKIELVFPNEEIAFKILDSTNIKGGLVHKEASYLAIYANRNNKSYTNIGFALSQIQLYLSSIGIGSFIHGLTHPISPYDKCDNLPFVILMTFGVADEELYRDVSLFDRKENLEFSNRDNIDNYLNTMKLAPSGRNRQPWFIGGNNDKLDFFVKKDNPIISRISPDLWFIDGGIALFYIYLEAFIQGKTPSFIFKDDINTPSSKHKYVCSICL